MLRSATDSAHQRLHRHDGFAAVFDETIDKARYAQLLRRLYGFHQPFEIAAAIEPVRSCRLAKDLMAMAVENTFAVKQIRRCPYVPAFDGPEEILGGLYVVEGSALGGRGLSRRLNSLLGKDAVAGRAFFSGNGTDTGATWHAYLGRLAELSPDPAVRHRVVAAAVATFAAFENWLRDWDSAS